MSFLWIEMLWLLWLLPLLVLVYLILQRRRQKFALRYASLSLVKEALGRGPGFRRHIPSLIFLFGLTVMLVALARPVAVVTLPSQQGTVILTIDVSRSMQANDLQPSRLEAAKAAAFNFVSKQPKNVRIGVVSFSDNASLVQAPTIDREQVRAAITRLTPQRATAIGQGILTSLAAILEQPGARPVPTTTDALGNPMPTSSPLPVPHGTFAPAIIILLSDGQNNVPPLPSNVVGQAVDQGVRIYTIGIGNPAGTVLTYMGRSVRVLLDETTLKNIAEKTDARYYRADNEADLSAIYGNLGTQLVFKPEQTELTAFFTASAIIIIIIAGALSLVWFSRLP
jgi:Ca-activated chloride channel homolog